MVKQTLQLLVSQATPGWMISVDGHEQYKADALTGPWSVYSQGVAPVPTVPCLVSKCMVLLSQVIFQYFGGLPPKADAVLLILLKLTRRLVGKCPE